DEAIRRLAEQELACRRALLEAGGDVNRVAGHEGLTARARPDKGFTGVDAELDREASSVIALQLGAQLADGLAQLDRGPKGPQGVVLVELDRSEDGDNRVAGELLDDAPVPLEDGGAELRVAVEDAVHRLRVEPLGKRRRA